MFIQENHHIQWTYNKYVIMNHINQLMHKAFLGINLKMLKNIKKESK